MPERTAHPMPPAVEAYLRALIRAATGATDVPALAFTWRGDGTGTVTWSEGPTSVSLPVRGEQARDVRALELTGRLPPRTHLTTDRQGPLP